LLQINSADKNITLPSNLNILLKKGILKGNNILIIGPHGIGKTIFCENISIECINRDISCIYEITDIIPNNLKH